MIKKIFCILCLLGISSLVCADNVTGELAAQLAVVKTAQSHFTEEKHLALFTAPVVSEGVFKFDKTAQKLRWEYQKPFANGFIVEGKKIFRVRDGKKTPVKNGLARSAAAQMMVWLTLDIDELVKTYRITQAENKLIFTPKNTANDVIDNISVWVERTENPPRVSAVKIAEKNGDYTLFNFTDSVLNSPIPAEDFQ